MRVVTYLRARPEAYDTQRALDAMESLARARNWAIRKTFIEKEEDRLKGTRPAWKALLTLGRRAGHHGVIIHSLDDLAEDVAGVVKDMTTLNNAHLHLISLMDRNIDTTRTHGKALLGMATILGDFQSRHKAQKARAALKSARGRGVQLGRPRVSLNIDEAIRRLDNGETIACIARRMGTSPSTVKRRLVEAGEWPRRSHVE